MRFVRTVAAAAGLALAGLALVIAPTASQAAPSRPTSDRSGIYSAAGVRQWLHCSGRGPVTVIVVPGLHATAASWAKVAPAFAATTRTCFYDRPGLGKSPARANKGIVLNADIYAHELWALLVAAGEPGPYVVVGHSFGGLIARTFVHQHLGSTAAVVLAESVDPSDRTTGRYWAEAAHRVDIPASQRATGGGPYIGSRPLLVLSASNPEGDHLGGPPYGQPQWMIDQWMAQQRADVRLSTNSIQVIARSGHVLQQDNPAATIHGLRTLVSAVKAHEELRCDDDWTKVKAKCRN